MITRAFVAVFAIAIAGCGAELDDEDSGAGDRLEAEHEGADDEMDAGGQLRARVCADGVTTKGIDISKWQGTIDWPKVANAGYAFAFVRVSDGVSSIDAKFAANWAGAKTVGLVRGAYQFFRPSQSVTAQADLMISKLGGQYTPGDLPPVIDVEDDGGLAPTTVAARARQWVDRVEAALGVKPIVYTGKYFWRDEVGSPASFAPNALWIAQYTSLCPDIPGPWSKWTFWQYTDSGTVPGIAGPVDINRFNGSISQLKAFAAGTPPRALPFRWQRSSSGNYTFTVEPGAGVAKVELRVQDFLIGAPSTTTGTGSLNYTFNVASSNRVIEARGVAADGTVVALGNGIIDSISSTAAFVRQTGEHEYEIGLERAPASWATVEVTVDGFALTDLDTGTTRSPRKAVRYKFNGLGNRPLTITTRDANGTKVDTRTRTLLVR
jgi:GH25 family lysozyme M1 (1,4-beta-N-acetylmuramidase)